MKEKPKKPAKSGKKEKVPTPEVELTPKQLKEKRREEARARAAETRKVVAAGASQWTGKLPAQLLNEHAQKMKWERVEYPTKSFGREPDQQWLASVVLARRNPKTKEIERVRFDPPSDRVPRQPTQIEARHLAATYGMHRILSHRNMKMMLPPLHRDLWSQLDEDKANAKPHEQLYKWSEDPWQAESDRKIARQNFEAEQKAKAVRREQNAIAREAQRDVSPDQEEHNSNSGKPPTSTKRVKFNNTLIMDSKTRSVVEAMTRNHNGFRFSTDDGLDKKRMPEKHAQIATMLQKLGFKLPFAEEALEYTSTLSAALTWLLIHVPEDDVPKSFMPSDIGVTARVSSGILVEKTATRLRELGYSEDVSRSTATSFHGSLRESVIYLTQGFTHHRSNVPRMPEDSDQSESESMWIEEIDTVKGVLEGQVSFSDSNQCTVRADSASLEVSFFRPKGYPQEIPGIAIAPIGKRHTSKFVLLQATRRAAEFAYSELSGDFMLLALFQQIEETFEDVVRSPGKLAQVSSGVSGVDETARLAEAEGEHKRHARREKRQNRHFDASKIAKSTKERMSTAAGQQMLEDRAKLPAWDKRTEIAKLVTDNQIVLITGETGSGKSTQAVQFILDAVPDAQIICTQPRRISAMGVAQRVADERLTDIGSQVGYVIRGEAKISRNTQIRFVTSGVLLRMLQGIKVSDEEEEGEKREGNAELEAMDISGLTHIFVDEVHERSLDGDFLLVLLKRLAKKAPNLKIVLMSATVDPKQFINYFSPMNVGYTHITGRTFPVEQHFLGEIIKETGYSANYSPSKDEVDQDRSEEVSVGKILGAIRAKSPGRVDYDLVGATVEYIHRKLLEKNDSNGSILVFMSGTGEIDQALRAISATSAGSALWTLPLHASLPPSDQKKVFQKAPRGLRKVVACTNVAETSITISDVVAVVDSGRVKETVYDPENNVSRLVDTWTSQASATQRMGRAGRVRAGECYKLYTENTQQSHMPPRPLPEMLKSPLEVLYLNVKAMGISDVEKFLSKAIDPPKSLALEAARSNLISYGAIDPVHNDLTPLGRHISVIPTDPRTAKLLVMGAMLGCLPRALTVAAILSNGRLPFAVKRDDNDAKAQLMAELGDESGDLMAGCKAYEKWVQGSANRDLISARVCRDISSARRQLLSSLIQIGFVDPGIIQGKHKEEDFPEELRKYDSEDAIVRAVIGASLQPNLIEAVFPQEKYLSTSAGAIKQNGVDDARAIKFFSANGERVFPHPKSLLFGATEFTGGSRYLSYGSAIKTSKHFVSDLTPLSIYSLALFAARIDVDPLGNGIVVDRWTGLRCWPRVGILLSFLQQLFGVLMDRKFRHPSANFIDHPVITLVHDLIESEGRAQGVGLIA